MFNNTDINNLELFQVSKENSGDNLACYILKEDWKLFFENANVKEVVDAVINIIQESESIDKLTDFVKSTSAKNELFWLSVVCLRLFLQENWTGPLIDISKSEIFNALLNENLRRSVFKIVENSGEEICIQAKYPSLIFISKTILSNLIFSNTDSKCSLSYIWSVKCLATYLSVIEEPSDHHFTDFKEKFYQAQENKSLSNFSQSFQAEYYLDSFHVFIQCYDYERCKFCLDEVKKLLKIEFALTGALGRRTKFQQFDLAQMKLDINKWGDKHQQSSNDCDKINISDVPEDILLDEETLLPDIKFVDGKEIKNVDLSPIEQAYAVTTCTYIQKTRPQDKLTYEEVIPYITQVLMLPQSWCVQYKSLFIRCIVEFTNSRKAERAFQQFESLLELYTKDNPSATNRLPLLHAVGLNTYWEAKRKYAHLLLSLGCVDSALEIFLPLKLWNDVILCYQRLGKHGKAEAVVREQLEKRESALLWNLLGDATMDIQYYEKAWQFSGHRNARSQRSIGLYYLRKEDFEKAIPYFQKSLELNCIQPGIAFSLGCCCMRIGDVKLAAKSFQHSVSLEPDNCQAWSNLASNFIRMNQLPKAYKALQEATRLSYDNWKIWENFLLVCADIGAFEDCIQCIHRLVEIGRKELDIQALAIVTGAIIIKEEQLLWVTSAKKAVQTSNIHSNYCFIQKEIGEMLNLALVIVTDAILKNDVDFKGNQAGRLKDRLLKMFGHVTSKITSDPFIWELYSKACYTESIPDQEKSLQLLYKSHRCYTMNTAWESSPKTVPSVMNVTGRMVKTTFTVCQATDNKTRAVSLYTTTKLSVNNLLTRLQKAYTSEYLETSLDIVKHLNGLRDYVNNLQEAINSIQ